MRSLILLVTLGLLALPAFAGSSNSLMDVSADGARLLVANTDSNSVSLVDLKTQKAVWELPVGDAPEGVSWAGDLALVTVYGDDVVLLLDPAQKKVLKTFKVADEPYGVVVTKDNKFAYITHDYPGSITEIDLTEKAVTRTFQVGSGLRGIAIANDENTLYVTEFFTANLIAVSRETGKIADRWDGFASDNLSRHVLLHPTRGKAYLSHIRSRTNAFDATGSIFPQLTMCDLVPLKEGEKRRRSIGLDTYNAPNVVTNPWEAAISPDGKTLYTVYSGTDDMNISKVVDDDYEEVAKIGRAITVGKHPRAIRTSPDGTQVYVYNTLDSAVAVFSSTMQKLGTIPVCQPAHTAEWRRGKHLFQSALQPMTSQRWIACSSCHPDGLSDGRVWQNPEGNRKTQNLFGLAHTHPLHWSADRDEVQDFEYTVRGKLMKGSGLYRGSMKQSTGFTDFAALDQKTSGLSADVDALAVYTNSFPFRLSPHAAAPGKLTPDAERGKAIFASTKTGCATCHSGPYFSDGKVTKPFNLHDVGTGGTEDEKIGPKFDTPTLLGVYRINTYLHDGRAKTLGEVLTTYNKADKHGTTSHLKKEEVEDLVAFLKSLPYELPPDETPNTVPHRLKAKSGG